MKVHSPRPVLDELKELYAIAVREHGPQARSARLIASTMARERESSRSPAGKDDGPGKSGACKSDARTGRSGGGPA